MIARTPVPPCTETTRAYAPAHARAERGYTKVRGYTTPVPSLAADPTTATSHGETR